MTLSEFLQNIEENIIKLGSKYDGGSLTYNSEGNLIIFDGSVWVEVEDAYCTISHDPYKIENL